MKFLTTQNGVFLTPERGSKFGWIEMILTASKRASNNILMMGRATGKLYVPCLGRFLFTNRVKKWGSREAQNLFSWGSCIFSYFCYKLDILRYLVWKDGVPRHTFGIFVNFLNFWAAATGEFFEISVWNFKLSLFLTKMNYFDNFRALFQNKQ